MGKELLYQAKEAAKQALMRGQVEVKLFGLTFTLEYSHDDVWHFLAPSNSIVFHLQKNSHGITVLA